MPKGKIAYPNLRAEIARSDISIQDIAKVIGVCYQQLCNVMSGYVDNKTIAARICEYLDLQT